MEKGNSDEVVKAKTVFLKVLYKGFENFLHKELKIVLYVINSLLSKVALAIVISPVNTAEKIR